MQIKIKEGSVNKHFLNPMSAIALLKKKRNLRENVCDMPYHMAYSMYLCICENIAACSLLSRLHIWIE